MKMKIAALVLIVLLPVLAVTATYATKPAMGSGTVTLVGKPVVVSFRSAGGNNFTTLKETFSLTGKLTGTAVALERDVTHGSSDEIFTTFQGEASFTSSNEAQSGTLTIHYVGVIKGTSVDGQFVAGNGTGTFADFHGQGSFSGTAGMTLNYSLNWHIDPAAAKTKTAA